MRPRDIASHLSAGGRVNSLSSGTNDVFRIFAIDGTTSILKVYGSSSYQRRERRALEALHGVPGLPTVIEWGATDETDWVRLVDAGRWNLRSLPGDTRSAALAGSLLRTLHEADSSRLSNLEQGIGAEWMQMALSGNFSRLERYRGKLGIPSSIFDRAVDLAFPPTTVPRAAHTRPGPSAFVIDDAGQVTLTGWIRATLAPPEWDHSYALWLLSSFEGSRDAFSAGYEATMDDDVQRMWTIFHITAFLLRAVERRDGGHDDLRPFVDQLTRAVG